jgi:uncharacterized Zn finger protein
MPRTIEGIVNAHTEAANRRATGRPVWDEKITAPRVEGAPFEQTRDAFVKALEGSDWFKRQEEGDELHQLWDEIKDAEDADHFDLCLDGIYDLADEDRIWVWFDTQAAATDAEAAR